MRYLFLIPGLLLSVANAAPAAFESGMNALLEGHYAKAFCQWEPLANQGYAEAQYNMGWLYANGNGMNVDMQEATRWWGLAAEQGHADAQFAIGLAFTTGEGLGKDFKEASHWFLKAARQGHLDSRDILVRLNADPRIDLVTLQPALLSEPWFGWEGLIHGERINVRAGPSTRDKILGKLTRGTEVQVVGRKGDWLQVLMPDTESPQLAWIYKNLIRAKIKSQ